MRVWRRLPVILVAAIGVLVVVLVVRTLAFEDRRTQLQDLAPEPAEQALDAAAAAQRLSQLLSVPTVSRVLATDADAEPFVELERRMVAAYPRVFGTLELERFGASLLLRWAGSSPELPPALLLAHQDVVPVAPDSERLWQQPPFSGAIAAGFVWGRGALDDKGSLGAILEATERLLEAGARPKRTIYLAFGHDEEIGGLEGSKRIAARLRERGVKLGYVLDEGPMIERGTMPGISRPLAKIGIAEKGYANIELVAEGEGGHAAMPPERTTVGLIARAIAAIQAAPMPLRLSEPMRAQLSFLAAELPFSTRLAFANLWLFEPMLLSRMSRAAAPNALVRTTVAPTVMQGSVKENVLAERARAVVNVRPLPGDTLAGVVDHLRKVIDDPRVSLAVLPQVTSEPSPVARTDSEAFRRIAAAARTVDHDALAVPALVVIATDARHFVDLAEDVYRFLPVAAEAADLLRLHGANERISIEAYARMVRFYMRWMAGG